MSMKFDITPEMAERPLRTIRAAEVLHMNARTIAAACWDAASDDVVVAGVDAVPSLAGIWTIPRAELSRRVPRLDDGWILTFSPASRRDEIESRCIALARSAFKRWELLRRWDSGHS